jgi:hypothetical protein
MVPYWLFEESAGMVTVRMDEEQSAKQDHSV